MTKVALISTLLLVGLIAKAQEIQGKAEYFSKSIIKTDLTKIKLGDKDSPDPELDKMLKDALKSASEKQYVLTFNKTECLYEEEQKLNKPSGSSGGMSIMVKLATAGKKYISVKDKKSIIEDEIFGKEFLIEEPLEKPEWKLINETKKIGDYTCYKAELVIPVSDKLKAEYEDFLKNEEKKPALFKMEKPEDLLVTAWYTPEIPVSFGPDNYWGLPGLILEVNDGLSVILCSKVVVNSKEKLKIKQPSTGEKISQKKFDKIKKEKYDSMKNDDGVIILRQ
jgi:GLPGLI family protein